MPLKAIILLGGPSKGTRFRPLSLKEPKPLFPICNVPLLHHHVEACKKLGSELVEVLMIGFFSEEEMSRYVEEVQREFTIRVRYLREEGELGTAGGLHKFKNEIRDGLDDDSLLVVLHGDILCTMPLNQLIAFHRAHGKTASILGKRVPSEEAPQYGCIVHDEDTNEVLHYTEKPETFVSDIVNCGIYVLAMNFFAELQLAALKAPSSRTIRASSSALLSDDVYLRMEQDMLVQLAGSGSFYCYVFDDWWVQLKHAGSPIDCSAYVLEEWRESRPEKLAVSTTDGPQIVGNVIIHPTATVHPSARIGPNVTVGPNVVIGKGVRVRQSILVENVTLRDRACVMYSILGWNSQVGRWARIEGVPDKDCPLKTGGITIFGEGVVAASESIIRTCVVLPNKELRDNTTSEIIL